jgi:hypothetical protein
MTDREPATAPIYEHSCPVPAQKHPTPSLSTIRHTDETSIIPKIPRQSKAASTPAHNSQTHRPNTRALPITHTACTVSQPHRCTLTYCTAAHTSHFSSLFTSCHGHPSCPLACWRHWHVHRPLLLLLPLLPHHGHLPHAHQLRHLLGTTESTPKAGSKREGRSPFRTGYSGTSPIGCTHLSSSCTVASPSLHTRAGFDKHLGRQDTPVTFAVLHAAAVL